MKLMPELNQTTLKALTRVFWVAVAVTSVTWVGSIAHRIIEKKNSVRTLESGVAIPVPAEAPGTTPGQPSGQ